MPTEALTVTFRHATTAEANRLASTLADALRNVYPRLSVQQQREWVVLKVAITRADITRADKQDTEGGLSSILGTAAAPTAVAKRIAAWLARNTGAPIEIRWKGKVALIAPQVALIAPLPTKPPSQKPDLRLLQPQLKVLRRQPQVLRKLAGVPRGDGSAVILVPDFLGTDHYLLQCHNWLRRIGYQTYYSGMPHLNDECPNLLIRQHLTKVIEKACRSTRRKIHLIGHGWGGTLARSVAAQMPNRIASVITLAAPIRALELHSSVLRTFETVRRQVLKRNGPRVLPDCYTAACTCSFLEFLKNILPKSVRQTAIYTKSDGIVDWRVCRTGDPQMDFEVSGTHIGLVFSPLVYSLVARRLAGE